MKQLKDDQKALALMTDEIYLKPYFNYKAVTVAGASRNSDDPAKSAHAFMVRSILSSNKDVVHILAASSIKGDELHCFSRKLIIRLENIGFKMIAVVTDKNSMNRTIMPLFYRDQSCT